MTNVGFHQIMLDVNCKFAKLLSNNHQSVTYQTTKSFFSGTFMYLTLKSPLKIKQCLVYNHDLKFNEKLDKTENSLHHGLIYSCQWLNG